MNISQADDVKRDVVKDLDPELMPDDRLNLALVISNTCS